jgi:serine/threonine protein kinase
LLIFIHRIDLKPDNIGFTGDGILKVFDFGLCTLVRTRTNASDTYEMTGNTGSLRYMAPEVCLQEPYTEKCDVYSYGIMLWQMARDRVPFQGFGKTDFIRQVVELNTRPKLDRSWPPQFINLVTRCWDRNPHKRPSFKAIVAELDIMIAAQK